MNRFERQINLRGFGIKGQNKLRHSSALVIGGGGLGCPALMYLAAAGIGKIGIADGDTVSVSNLNRQIFFGEKDDGKKKVSVISSILSDKYSDIEIEIFPDYLTTHNTPELLSPYDIILDCTDNFSARYLINDACVLLNKPLVHGSIFEYQGQVTLFNVKNNRGETFNYRDLFTVAPDSSQIPNCDETGVLGVLPGMIGTLQATEAIKYLSGTGTLLSGRLLCYNMEIQQFYDIEITHNPESLQHMPLTIAAFREFDYSLVCPSVQTLDWNEAYSLFNKNPMETIFVDVRERTELPRVKNIPVTDLPLSILAEDSFRLTEKKNLLIFCQGGIRSIKAAKALIEIFPKKHIFSIRGGVMDEQSPVNEFLYEREV